MHREVNREVKGYREHHRRCHVEIEVQIIVFQLVSGQSRHPFIL
jgi:hypothetical protein